MPFLICLKGLAEVNSEFKVRLGCVVGFTASRRRNYTADLGVIKDCSAEKGADATGDSSEEDEDEDEDDDDTDTPAIMVLVSNTQAFLMERETSESLEEHANTPSLGSRPSPYAL